MSRQSAKRIPSRMVSAVFDIPKSDLISIVESAVHNGPVTSLEIQVEHEILNKGMSSETIIPTFYYRTECGTTGDVTVFVKRQSKLDIREAPEYIRAEKTDIPTPRYYGHFDGSRGEEIIFLEFLPEIGIDNQDEAEVQALVSLIAHINTVPLRYEHFGIPKPVPREQAARDIQLDFEQNLIPRLEQILASGAAGEVGLDVQTLCGKNPRGVEVLSKYAFILAHRIATLPEDSLVQGDTGGHNMGWRVIPEGKELVAFDLDFQLGRRFYDIGYIMHNQLEDSALSTEEIAIHYLGEYTRRGGEDIILGDFLKQTRWLADYDMLWSLPWLWRTALKQIEGGNPSVDENGNDFPAWLHEYLRTLLETEQMSEAVR
ncbi:hypothetical protein H8E77_21950 [bacterium]|nr:hypothetical protein [bacterium]